MTMLMSEFDSEMSEINNEYTSEVKSEVSSSPPPHQQERSSYKNNNYQDNKQQFKRKKISDKPYVPIAVFVDDRMPEEAINFMKTVAEKLMASGYTIRITGDHVPTVKALESISKERLEIYLPWRGFNDLTSSFYYNEEALRSIAKSFFMGWDKVPDPVKAIVTRNIRMIFGQRNNSCAHACIIFTPDGAVNTKDIGPNTGNYSTIIRVCSRFNIPLINIKNDDVMRRFSAHYGL